MADTLTPAPGELGTWEGRGVRMSEVLSALDELRRNADHTATRTTVLTLIVSVESRQAADDAFDVLRFLGAHPARVLGVISEPEASAELGLDATVRLLEASVDEHRVWYEDLCLTVRGPACGHLDSLVEPITLADLPVAVWFPSQLPARDDPLLSVADVLVVDAKEAGRQPGKELQGFFGLRPVIDLAWIRLSPWRELLARLFDGPVYQPFVSGVHSAEVRGKPGPRRLLAGWLASRLNLPPTAIHMEDDLHASIRLEAHHAGHTGRFWVTRTAGTRVVEAGAEIDDGPSHHEMVTLPDDTLPWSLSRALIRLRHDRVYEAAVKAAATL
jgi:glucose-6-phosphate dehydrogenase assembly protein OpcA